MKKIPGGKDRGSSLNKDNFFTQPSKWLYQHFMACCYTMNIADQKCRKHQEL